MTTGCRSDEVFSDHCPVRDLPDITNIGIDGAITQLARSGIDPDRFHFENLDRFQFFNDCCTPNQVGRFQEFSETLGDRIAHMSTESLRQNLQSLYREAYVFDEAAGTMTLGTTPSQRQAKRRLDLWIAAVDHRAYQDEDFLGRLWDDKHIRIVMLLNSPDLTPEDRGSFEKFQEALAQGGPAMDLYLQERALVGHRRLFDWLRHFDGTKPMFEDPFWVSVCQVAEAQNALLGRDASISLSLRFFQREEIEGIIREFGYWDRYQAFHAMTDQKLIDLFSELSVAGLPDLRAPMRKRMVEDLLLVETVLEERHINPSEALRSNAIRSMTQFGYNQDDAELILELQQAFVHKTADRLDDYRARFGLMRRYRELYQRLLTHPLAEVFSAADRARYVQWGRLILNRSVSKVPIFLEDLDRIRREEQNLYFSRMSFGQPGRTFLTRDPSVPTWYRPVDLGACGSTTGGPLVYASGISVGGQTVNDLICNNVELMAFLPENLHPDHALATAIGVFGVITVRGRTFDETVAGAVRNIDWTPGTLLEAATHEAAHVRWFRVNFDREPQRLPMLALNERYAYAEGRDEIQTYTLAGLAEPGEARQLAARTAFMNELITVTNASLNIPVDRTEADYWDSHWDGEPSGRFQFQPADVFRWQQTEKRLEERFGPIPPDRIRESWSALFADEVSKFTPEERAEAEDGLRYLESPANKEQGVRYFLRSDPLTRVVNAMQLRLGLLPLTAIVMSQSEWASFESDMGQRAVTRFRIRAYDKGAPAVVSYP